MSSSESVSLGIHYIITAKLEGEYELCYYSGLTYGQILLKNLSGEPILCIDIDGIIFTKETEEIRRVKREILVRGIID
jgi:hypothetical protein